MLQIIANLYGFCKFQSKFTEEFFISKLLTLFSLWITWLSQLFDLLDKNKDFYVFADDFDVHLL